MPNADLISHPDLQEVSFPLRRSIRISDIALSYLQWGNRGPRVALFHGITSNAASWWRLAPALAAEGCQVVAFDMPGHGYSGETADHRIASVAELMASALRALQFREGVVIGHSWGGAIAFALAASNDHNLARRIVLLDPALRMSAVFGATQVPIFSTGIGRPIEEALPALASANPDWHERDLYWKAEALLQCRQGAVTGFFTQSGEWDLTPMFAGISMPVLVLCADPQKTIIDPATAATAKAILDPKHIAWRVINGTTHNMHRGSGFDATKAALFDWLFGGCAE